MWHHASFKGDELIVLGHDPRRNDCMLVRLSGLPMNEQADLRRVAASRSAQESTYLIPLLRRIESPQGIDWFTYLCKKMEQRNSPVFTLPLKEIQDSIDPDQKAIFKGYGKGRRNASLDMLDLERAQTGGVEQDEEDLPYVRGTQPAPQANHLDNKLDMMIETIADESRQTRQMMMQLIQAIGGNTKAAAPAKKPARPRKTVNGASNAIGSKKKAATEIRTEA